MLNHDDSQILFPLLAYKLLIMGYADLVIKYLVKQGYISFAK